MDYTNYGNRLQNYALSSLLKAEGFEVISGLAYSSKQEWIDKTKSKYKKNIKKIIPFPIYVWYTKRNMNKFDEITNRRIEKFKKFTESYTYTYPYLYIKNDKDLRKQIKESDIDYFVAGSDQVWHPRYEAKSYDFLLFTSPHKRLSFSASIGVDAIPKEQREYFKQSLQQMRYISVREKAAAKIIKDLLGKDVELTLDPTLLLDRDKWINLAKKPNLDLNERYIFAYFLGEIPNAVAKFSKEKGLPVYFFNNKEYEKFYNLDPAEFIYMLIKAEYILTDSFHAVALSIKLNKNFYVFDRVQKDVKSMFSRIETITQLLGLEKRIQNRDRIQEEMDISDKKWEKIQNILDKEKKESMKHLKREML